MNESVKSFLYKANIVLDGVVGSQAYGLATASSDVDILGIYLSNAVDFLGLNPPNDKNSTFHNVSDETDYTYHELTKFCKKALSGNPTLLEFLFLEEYETRSTIGDELLSIRKAFLSEKVRDSFCGYAKGQALDLERREKEGKEGFASDLRKRREKHARHCFRLLLQGKKALETGSLIVKLSDEEKEYVLNVSTLETSLLLNWFNREYEKVKNVKSVLPTEPDYDTVNRFLLKTRLAQLGSSYPIK